MPGEAGAAGVESYTRALRDAQGKGPDALMNAVIDGLGKVQHEIGQGAASRDGLSRAVEEIRATADAAKVAAIEAQRNALPPGTEAEAFRAYADVEDDDAGPMRTLDLGEYRRGDALSRDNTPILQGGGQRVRMVGQVDQYGDYRPGYLDDPNPRSAGQKEAQVLAGLVGLARGLRASGARGVNVPVLERRLLRHMRAQPGFSRMLADNPTEGAEWIPDTTGSTLIQYMQLPRPVLDLFATRDIPRNDFKNPFLSSGLQPFGVGTPAAGDLDPATVRQSQIGTGEIVYSAKTLIVSSVANRDASEDSIIAFGPTMFAALAAALLDAREDAMLNGDSAATHGDTLAGWTAGGRWNAALVGGSDDHRHQCLGLRHRALDRSATLDFDNASISTDIFKLRGKLTAGYTQENLAIITSIEALIYHMLVDANMRTVDKTGERLATQVTGQVATVGSTPVVLSGFMSPSMTTAGIYDGSTTTQTGLLLVDRSRIVRPRIRDAISETTVVPYKHAIYVTASDREGVTFECGSTEDPVAYGINISNDGS